MYDHERSLVQKLVDKPFALIGVNTDGDIESIRKIVKEKNVTWRSFWNGEKGTWGPISSRWNITSWPTLYLIDANGIIRHAQEGGDQETLIPALEGLLEEMGHPVDLLSD